jgi:hypothetical protein
MSCVHLNCDENATLCVRENPDEFKNPDHFAVCQRHYNDAEAGKALTLCDGASITGYAIHMITICTVHPPFEEKGATEMAKTTQRKKSSRAKGGRNGANAGAKHTPPAAEETANRDADGSCKYCAAAIGKDHDKECPLYEDPIEERRDDPVEADGEGEADAAAEAFEQTQDEERELRTEVNGEEARVVLSGKNGAPIDDDRLVEVSLEELVHTLALKRAEIKQAKSEYSRAGSRVKSLQDDEEKILRELDRRDERRHQGELNLDEGESDDDEDFEE